MSQQRVAKQSSRAETEDIEEIPQTAPEESSLTSDVDDLLDDIDSVLEENAEEFVRSYVQKGGQ